jgi:NAD(P)-dependent dehydrogenase (short-subunit alcohol dehydrogenase family)
MIANLSGKVALCAGATNGIGKGIAYKLAELNANVAIIARKPELGKQIISDLRSISPKGQYEVIPCEATSMKSISNACAEFDQKFDKLNFLVLSQGKAMSGGRDETSEGIDKKMALHYYGRVLFIKKLGETLRKTALVEDVRVLSVLSGGRHSAYDNLDDLALKKSCGLQNAANAAGFYNDLALDQFSRDFSAVEQRVSFIHAYPGWVSTGYADDMPFPLNKITKLLTHFATPADECGTMMVNNALLGDHMGPVVRKALNVGQPVPAGFHTMNPKGEKSKLTDRHSDAMREAVWRHTNEELERALSTANVV